MKTHLKRNDNKVDAKRTIGIYITANSATVSVLSGSGKDMKVADSITVKTATRSNLIDNPESARLLAEQIEQGVCAAMQFSLKDAALSVAVDSAFFLQHLVHSDFSDAKQISQTIRFDTEEALAADISDLAIAFQIASLAQSGSNLSVFTCQTKSSKKYP